MDSIMTFKDLFKGSVLKMQPWASLGLGDIALRLAMSFVLAGVIFYVYRRTFQGVVYSRSFNISIITVSMVTTAIIMAISGNLVISLGMVGALSIVRFRMPVKDSMDIVFIFWGIAVGIANGIGYFKLSVSSTLIISLILMAFNRKKPVSFPHLLTVVFQGIDAEPEIIEAIENSAEKFRIRNTTFESSYNEICAEVRLPDDQKREMLKSIKQITSVERATLISHSGDIEPL
jgi:uncharacterized membrane protein YhiD involved in acid resistance